MFNSIFTYCKLHLYQVELKTLQEQFHKNYFYY